MSLMNGKKGLILGVANERSIAWGIAQKLSEAGAELAFTYLGDALKKRVIPLAEKLNSKVTFSCDVEKKEDVIKLFEIFKSSSIQGEIRFVGGCVRNVLSNKLVDDIDIATNLQPEKVKEILLQNKINFYDVAIASIFGKINNYE
mgnify:CR=1 FL=1